MNKHTEFKLAKLRIAVALLGEENSWWGTKFFKEESNAFLDYIFPRSKKAKQICSSDVVQKIVDQKVGANHYHLFRLSINHEEHIHGLLKKDEIRIKNVDEAFKVLQEISEGLSVDQTPGPKNIGSLDQLDQNAIQAFAAEYLHAFMNNYQVYPYLN